MLFQLFSVLSIFLYSPLNLFCIRAGNPPFPSARSCYVQAIYSCVCTCSVWFAVTASLFAVPAVTLSFLWFGSLCSPCLRLPYKPTAHCVRLPCRLRYGQHTARFARLLCRVFDTLPYYIVFKSTVEKSVKFLDVHRKNYI